MVERLRLFLTTCKRVAGGRRTDLLYSFRAMVNGTDSTAGLERRSQSMPTICNVGSYL